MAFRGRGPRFVPPPPDAHRTNRNIRSPEVRLVGADGDQLGIVPIADALRLAEDASLDLVEVAPTAQPPVCRIMDYGKFKYEQHKKESEARKKQSTTEVKELRLGYKTDVGDLARQIEKARQFIAEGDRVKFTLRFRGREMAYQDLGRAKLNKICEALADVASVEGTPKMEGRLMGVVLAPGVRKKPKVPAAPRPAVTAPVAEAPAAEAPAAAPDPAGSGSPD